MVEVDVVVLLKVWPAAVAVDLPPVHGVLDSSAMAEARTEKMIMSVEERIFLTEQFLKNQKSV